MQWLAELRAKDERLDMMQKELSKAAKEIQIQVKDDAFHDAAFGEVRQI